MFSLNSSSLLLLAGAVLALWLVMRRGTSGRQAAWRQSREDEVPRRLAAKATIASAANEAPADYLRWQVEMHETARELKGELDSKLSALQALVIMARQESERLEAALAQLQAVDMSPPHDFLDRIVGLADPAQLANPDALSAVAEASPAAPTCIPGDLFNRDRLADEVYRLADRGLSASHIAAHLRLPVGDVELLLSLRPE